MKVLALLCIGGMMAVFLFQTTAGAGELTIPDKAKFIVPNGFVEMACMPIIVKSGGTFQMDGGEINHCRTVKFESGGIFTRTGGIIRYCWSPGVNLLLLQ